MRAQVQAGKRGQGTPRVLEPNRKQIELRASDLESLLGEDHRARLVWGYVERQELSALFNAIKARGAAPGRRAIDPRILFALWLYATLDGVGSGREVTRLTREHDAYRWICGGVSVNYHALNDSAAPTMRCWTSCSAITSQRWPPWVRSPWSVWRKTACACVLTPGRPRSDAKRAWRNTWPRHANSC